jgi:hypothetical protein
MSEKSPFNPALLGGLIAAGILSFALFVALIALGGGDAAAGRGGRATAASPSAIGFRGLVELSERYFPTEFVRRERDLFGDELVVVALEPRNTPEEVAELRRRRAGQPTLIILPKWAVARDPDNARHVRAIGPLLADEADRLMGPDIEVEPLSASARRRVEGFDALAGLAARLPREPQVIHGDDVHMLLGVPGEGALVAQLGDEPHYVVADPDLMNNHGLRDPRTAAAAVRILSWLRPEDADTVRFDLTVNGVNQGQSLIRSMFTPPFLAMTLALIAAALLAAYHGAIRFGPPRRAERAIPFGKAALVENSAGLIRLARREVRLGGGYADVVRDDAARAGAAPPTLRDEALEAYLDRFTRGDRPPFSALAGAVRSARSPGELLAAARALFQWKKDLVR